MATEKSKIKDVTESYEEAFSAQNDLLSEIELDDRMYLGDQKNESDVRYMKDKKIPDITINKISKPCNLVTGYYSQNRLDLKYYPIEGSDQEGADIYTELAKWTLTKTVGNYSTSVAFGDSSRTGLGWLNIEMDYTKDPINGDPNVGFEDKYHILFDPYGRNPDPNEDWGYILRYAWPTKEKVIALYPDMENDIRKLKTGKTSSYFPTQQPQNGINDTGQRINIIEKWYKQWEKKTIMIDPVTFESYEWKGGKSKLKQLQEQRPELMNSISIVEVKAPKIKLMTIAEDKVLLYDDDPPEGFSRTQYPFIPVFGYYIPNFNEWKWKVFGIVRQLRPMQREYNKMRSLMMEAAMSIPISGYKYETGAVEDPAELKKRGTAQYIEVRPNKMFEQLAGPQINQALTQLHQMHHDDLTEVGPNPDLLGMVGGGSSPDVSGVTLNLRKNQGMMTLQNPFDGIGLSHRIAGRYLIDMYNMWDSAKIERIIGRPVPKNWDRIKHCNRFDCIIDERSSSPTVRMADLATMQGFVQHGMQIPPEVIRELSDIPAKVKQLWAGIDQKNTEMALKQRDEDIKLKMMEFQAKSKVDIGREKLKIDGTKEVTQMNIDSKEKMQEKDLINKLAIEKIQEGIVSSQMRENANI